MFLPVHHSILSWRSIVGSRQINDSPRSAIIRRCLQGENDMLNPALSQWLDVQAQALDLGQCDPQDVISRLATAKVLRIGVPETLGGSGGTVADGVESIAQVASHSLAAAFVFWGQRAFIEYLLHSPNTALREHLLPSL